MIVVILKNYEAVVVENVCRVHREEDVTNGEKMLFLFDKHDNIISAFKWEEIIGYYPTFCTKDGREVIIE